MESLASIATTTLLRAGSTSIRMSPCLAMGIKAIGKRARAFHRSHRPSSPANPKTLQELMDQAKRPDTIKMNFNTGYVTGTRAPASSLRMPPINLDGMGSVESPSDTNASSLNDAQVLAKTTSLGIKESLETRRPFETARISTVPIAKSPAAAKKVETSAEAEEPSLEDLIRRTKGVPEWNRLLGPRSGMSRQTRPSSLKRSL
ncbi:hypothetical protein BJ508DRAFT_302743 [Ascobolus immersus RN42]|uniref:Uncharacterized protein n=1 Tax=Ascobolus immersus RN42 TaxID=1160509 RepID=A0A3N4IH52_ASCIM|nr:hypothetical protein BJ508DRAFT_302743 [Ascobolus immersus RN42]